MDKNNLPTSVKAPVGYQKKMTQTPDQKLIYIPSEIDKRDDSKWAGEREMIDCEILSGREKNFQLHKNGFELHKLPGTFEYTSPTGLQEFDSALTKYIRQWSGCDSIQIFDHTLRSSDFSQRQSERKREPSAMMHGDFTSRSGLWRLAHHCQIADPPQEPPKFRRLMVLNVWKSSSGPILRDPLLLIDSQSIRSEEIYTVERRDSHRVGEIYQVAHHPDQKLYFFPSMQEEEMILFKTFDSNPEPEQCACCFHSAFEHESVPNAPPRNSIETRLFLFWN